MPDKDASVLITGASRGIGRTIAIGFARHSDRPLILLARTEEGLNQTRSLCKQEGAKNVKILVCDAAQESDVQSLVLDEVPAPGILINNAGNFLLKPLEQTTGKEMEEQLRHNLLTAVNVTRRFLPGIKNKDHGLIVNICSTASVRGYSDIGTYSTAKHALLGYTRSLRKELMDWNIAVTAVNLGQTQSSSWEASDMDPDRLIDPEDLAMLLVTLSRMSGRTVVDEILITPQNGEAPRM